MPIDSMSSSSLNALPSTSGFYSLNNMAASILAQSKFCAEWDELMNYCQHQENKNKKIGKKTLLITEKLNDWLHWNE